MSEYTIDELARAADTTVRNIRAYRSKGLLPAPRRSGRANLYSEVHVARLRLIGRLLGRGYTLGNISEMLEVFDRGEGVSDLLGLEAALTTPFSSELPTYITLTELNRLFDRRLSPADIPQAIRLGLLREEEGRLMVPSPRLLNVGAELAREGVPMSAIFVELAHLRDDMTRIANRFVQLIQDEVFDRYGKDALPPVEERARLTEFIYRVRPMAQTAVEVELARALESAISAAFGHRLARVRGAVDLRTSSSASSRRNETG